VFKIKVAHLNEICLLTTLVT